MGSRPRNFKDITDDLHNDILDYVILKKNRLLPVAPHRHSFLEISFIIKGTGSETVNGKTHPLQPGAFTLLLPYHIHEIYSCPDDPLSLYNIAISLEQIYRQPDDFGLRELLLLPGKNPPPFFQLSTQFMGLFENSMSVMLTEYNQKKPWSDVVFRARLAELLVLFNRLRLTEPIPPETDQCCDLLFWDLVQYIHMNHDENISLTLLEQQFRLPAHKISRLFIEKTGVHFHDFLDEIRVEHACSLLASSNLKITDIAMDSGFNSYVTFSKTFRKIQGQTAFQYKNSAKKKARPDG